MVFGENSVGRSAREEGKKETKRNATELLETSDEDTDYSQFKELAQKRARRCRWQTKTCP